MRRENKKAKRHQHRWRRRIIYTLSTILALGVLAVGGGYLYVNYRYNQIKKIHAPHLVKAAPPGQPFNILLVGSDSRAFVGDNADAGQSNRRTAAMPAVSAATSPWWPGSFPPPSRSP